MLCAILLAAYAWRGSGPWALGFAAIPLLPALVWSDLAPHAALGVAGLLTGALASWSWTNREVRLTGWTAASWLVAITLATLAFRAPLSPLVVIAALVGTFAARRDRVLLTSLATSAIVVAAAHLSGLSMQPGELDLRELDDRLLESASELQATLIFLAAPTLAFVGILFRSPEEDGKDRFRRGHVAIASVLLVLLAGAFPLSHAQRLDRIATVAASWIPTIPPNATLPRIDGNSEPATARGPVVVVGDEIRRGAAVLGPRALLRDPDRLRGAFDGDALTLLLSEDLRASELYGLLHAAAREEPLSVQLLVAGDPRPLHGPLASLRPASGLSVTYRQTAAETHVHIAREATLLRRGSEVRPVSLGDLASVENASLSADGEVDILLVLESIAALPGDVVLTREAGARPTRTAIDANVRAHVPALQRCYDASLARAEDLSGRLLLEIRIDAAGQSRAAVLQGLDERLDACVVTIVEGWTFPAGNPATIRYPFLFTQPQDSR
ncbi:MAG: AgmX/PglI C-terminal domain-containing protein [Myxococcota bacterium]